MVVVVDGLAASGGYIAALAADHIVAQETSLVGSIGVLFQYPNFAELLKTLGVKVEEIKSSPLKAAPNGFEPTTPEARAAIEAIVIGLLRLVPRAGAGRAASSTTRRCERVADGRVFTGRQGAGAQARRRARRRADGDRLAGQGEEHRSEDAGARLSAARPVQRPAVPAHGGDRDARRRSGLARSRAASRRWGAVQAIERLNLDGLLALWHPPAAN